MDGFSDGKSMKILVKWDDLEVPPFQETADMCPMKVTMLGDCHSFNPNGFSQQNDHQANQHAVIMTSDVNDFSNAKNGDERLVHS